MSPAAVVSTTGAALWEYGFHADLCPETYTGEALARALLERFTSTAGNNFINYNNAEYDAFFQEAVSAADDAAQTAAYKQAEANLTENAANVYIQDLADLVAIRKGLTGVRFYPIYVLDLSGIRYTD